MNGFKKSEERELREKIAFYGRSMFDRGLTMGSSGNISIRMENGWLMTPTNSCLGHLDPDRISFLDKEGNHVSGDKPSKEFFLHDAFLSKRPNDHAVVHLHSSYATALGCLRDVDPMNMIPPLTPYSIMRFGKVAMTPYHRPGDKKLGDEIEKVASEYNAVILANHGPIVVGSTLEKTVYAIEELEETAKLHLLTLGQAVRPLNQEQIQELYDVYVNKENKKNDSCC